MLGCWAATTDHMSTGPCADHAKSLYACMRTVVRMLALALAQHLINVHRVAGQEEDAASHYQLPSCSFEQEYSLGMLVDLPRPLGPLSLSCHALYPTTFVSSLFQNLVFPPIKTFGGRITNKIH
jgi:hypothetical protein